ncbi:MAG: 4'-phosphopantetheinyl transferase superfamily protein [Betaproteobacteria bacterium]
MNAVSIIPLPIEWSLRSAALARDEVRIYRTSLSALEPHWERLSRRLSREEAQKALAYRLTGPRRRFELVRGCLRELLSALLGCDARQVAIERNTEGKPQLSATGEPPLHFNVSHSRDLALFAVCASAAVGVDVEYIDKAINAELVMQTAFSDVERTACYEAGEANVLEQFFRTWTRKEARIKACGLAMAHRFFASSDRLPVLDLQLSDEYVGAVAVYGNGERSVRSPVSSNLYHKQGSIR